MGKRTSTKRTLVLGTGPLARELLEEIPRHSRCEYDIIGVVVEPASTDAVNSGHDSLGAMVDLDQVLL